MLNKIFLIIVLLMPTLAFAGNGSFTFLDEGESSPFKGTLFDDDATAHLLTLPDYYQTGCDLQLDYQLGLQEEKFSFQIKDLEAEVVYIETERDSISKQKDERIIILEEQIKKNNKNDSPYIFAGGIAIGIGVTLGIIKALGSAQ